MEFCFWAMGLLWLPGSRPPAVDFKLNDCPDAPPYVYLVMDLTDIDAGRDSLAAIFNAVMCFSNNCCSVETVYSCPFGFKMYSWYREGWLFGCYFHGGFGKIVLYKYKVCSKHFTSGKPAYLYNTTNPDWLPTLNHGHKNMGMPSLRV